MQTALFPELFTSTHFQKNHHSTLSNGLTKYHVSVSVRDEMQVLVLCIVASLVKSINGIRVDSAGLYLLYSDTSLIRSSVEILLLSCLKRGENRDSLSSAPWLSLNTDLQWIQNGYFIFTEFFFLF